MPRHSEREGAGKSVQIQIYLIASCSGKAGAKTAAPHRLEAIIVKLGSLSFLYPRQSPDKVRRLFQLRVKRDGPDGHTTE